MAKCKRSAARALAWLVSEGAEVVAVVASEPDELTRDEQRVDLVASRCGLPLVAEEDLYREPPAEVDLVVSFLFWNRIREPLLSLGRVGCLNFHPAPLPDIRGVGGYNVALVEGMREWGVSCHFVDAGFDTGDLVEVERFPIDPDAQTAFSLDLQSQERLYELFKRVMRPALAGCGRATTWSASCARSGTPPTPARWSSWTAASSRSWTSGCCARPRRHTGMPATCRSWASSHGLT
jgi:methionyl-tRNA formyltransferase